MPTIKPSRPIERQLGPIDRRLERNEAKKRQRETARRNTTRGDVMGALGGLLGGLVGTKKSGVEGGSQPAYGLHPIGPDDKPYVGPLDRMMDTPGIGAPSVMGMDELQYERRQRAPIMDVAYRTSVPAAPQGLLKDVHLDFVGNYKAGVDARLTDVLEKAAVEFERQNPGYSVQAFSGKNARASGTKNHPAGRATDVNIIGPDGKALANRKNAGSFRTYEKFAQTARAVQMREYPELNKNFRWGGYFHQGVAFDQMHFDIGGSKKVGTAYGSWENGLSEAGKRALPGAQSVGMIENEIDIAGLPNIPDDPPAQESYQLGQAVPNAGPAGLAYSDMVPAQHVQTTGAALKGLPTTEVAQAAPSSFAPGLQPASYTETASPVPTTERVSPVPSGPSPAPIGAPQEVAKAMPTGFMKGNVDYGVRPLGTMTQSPNQGLLGAAVPATQVQTQAIGTAKTPTTIEDPAVNPDVPMAGNAVNPPAPQPKPDIKDALKKAAMGFAVGGLPGAAIGLAGGLLGGKGLSGLLGGGPFGPVSPGERFNVGSGIPGIEGGMYGNRGATGYSRSNPGAFTTSLGPGQGYDLTNQKGAITHYDAQGHITATPYSGIGLGGLLGRMTGGLLGNDRGGFSDKERGYANSHAGLF